MDIKIHPSEEAALAAAKSTLSAMLAPLDTEQKKTLLLLLLAATE